MPAAVPRSEMTVGQWAIAVGRTYEQPEPNMSVGVLSATNRIWSKAIQTDAKISPANYGGPLIDIQGRVLGVLVPLSPQRQGGEVAGAEWYDSGIGFAVPLADIIERLPTLKSGKDLHPGLLGISLKPGDIYALPAEIGRLAGRLAGLQGGPAGRRHDRRDRRRADRAAGRSSSTPWARAMPATRCTSSTRAARRTPSASRPTSSWPRS